MVEVTTVVESAGQSVMLAAQLVMVISLVVYTVEVVNWAGVVMAGVEGAGVPVPAGVSLADEDQADEETQTEDDAPAGVSLGEGDAIVDPTGRTLLGLGTAGKDEELTAAVVSVTGQTVVEIAMVEVTTVVESAGQSVMLAAQLVMVISLVVYTVEVVN
jgi:hypothetical protein